jgi:hypothetical protein
MTATMRHVLCDAKRRRLTMIPTENAPNAPIMESYGEDDKVNLGLVENLQYQTDGDAQPQ